MTSVILSAAVQGCIEEQAQQGGVSKETGHSFAGAVIAFAEVRACMYISMYMYSRVRLCATSDISFHHEADSNRPDTRNMLQQMYTFIVMYQ